MKEQIKTDATPVDQHIRDLINAGVDGEISAAEQAELDQLLVSSESVRNYDKQLRLVTALLDEMPVVEPPRHLQSSIERQVRLPAGGVDRKKPGVLGIWLESQWLRTGLALAAGVVLTFGVYEMGSRPITNRDAENLTGTMVKKEPTGQQGRILDSFQLDSAQLNGLVELRNKDDLFTLDMQLNSPGPVEVVVDFAGRGLEFDDAASTLDSNNAFSIRDGAIHFASNGEKHFSVKLRRTADIKQGDPIELDFFTGDQLVEKAELNTSRY